jgi:3-oxoacyl-[acyl-carrier protein] reductase
VAADVTQPEAVQAMVAQVLREAGKIDVVVNNAFAPYRFDPEQRKMFWDTTWADYQTQVDGAVRATYNVCQAVLPHLRQRGQGSLINLVSDLTERPSIPYHDYITAKSALVGFSHLGCRTRPLGHSRQLRGPGAGLPHRRQP